MCFQILIFDLPPLLLYLFSFHIQFSTKSFPWLEFSMCSLNVGIHICYILFSLKAPILKLINTRV